MKSIDALVRLDSLWQVKREKRTALSDFYKVCLENQIAFLEGFVKIYPRASLEIRFIKRSLKPFRIGVYILARISEDTEHSSCMVSALEQFLISSLRAFNPNYKFSIVQDEEEIRSTIMPFAITDVAEILRRDGCISLDACIMKTHTIRGFSMEDNSERTNAINMANIYIVYPFILSNDTRERVCKALLAYPGSVCVSIVIKPYQLSREEKLYLESCIDNCEKAAKLEINSTAESTYLRLQAGMLYKDYLQKLRHFEEHTLALRIRIATENFLQESLLTILGASITANPGWLNDGYTNSENPLFSGGYRIRRPKDEPERISMRDEFLNSSVQPWAQSIAPHGKEALLHLSSLIEAATAFRLPLPIEGTFPGLDTIAFSCKPAPSQMPKQGVLIGRRRENGQLREIRIPAEDRLRHTYIIGQTGTGKSTLLKTMLLDDARSGGGFCLIDPHGELVEDVYNSLPRERLNDVIYIDPTDTKHPITINLLKVSSSLERDFVVNYLIEIFYAIYNKEVIGGPMFEMYLRGTLMLLLCQPEGFVPCFMDILSVLQSRKIRQDLLQSCTNSLVINFWSKEAENVEGEIRIENIVPYITSKFSAFLYNDTLKAIMSKRESQMDFANFMEQGRIVLVDLRKGLIGSTNAYYLGMIITGEIIRAALSRSISRKFPQRPFYLYIDEFQNIATPSLINILSESRKFGVGAILANQYLDQLNESIMKSVIGNVGTIITFRMGKKDADLFSQVFAGVVDESELLSTPNFHAYIRPLFHGETIPAFDIETYP